MNKEDIKNSLMRMAHSIGKMDDVEFATLVTGASMKSAILNYDYHIGSKKEHSYDVLNLELTIK